MTSPAGSDLDGGEATPLTVNIECLAWRPVQFKSGPQLVNPIVEDVQLYADRGRPPHGLGALHVRDRSKHISKFYRGMQEVGKIDGRLHGHPRDGLRGQLRGHPPDVLLEETVHGLDKISGDLDDCDHLVPRWGLKPIFEEKIAAPLMVVYRPIGKLAIGRLRHLFIPMTDAAGWDATA